MFLAGCTIKLEGTVFVSDEDRVLVAKKPSNEQYEELKDKPYNELFEMGLNLTYYRYEDVAQFQKGDRVKIWTEGIEQTSYPTQASASKNKLIK